MTQTRDWPWLMHILTQLHFQNQIQENTSAPEYTHYTLIWLFLTGTRSHLPRNQSYQYTYQELNPYTIRRRSMCTYSTLMASSHYSILSHNTEGKWWMHWYRITSHSSQYDATNRNPKDKTFFFLSCIRLSRFAGNSSKHVDTGDVLRTWLIGQYYPVGQYIRTISTEVELQGYGEERQTNSTKPKKTMSNNQSTLASVLLKIYPFHYGMDSGINLRFQLKWFLRTIFSVLICCLLQCSCLTITRQKRNTSYFEHP